MTRVYDMSPQPLLLQMTSRKLNWEEEDSFSEKRENASISGPKEKWSYRPLQKYTENEIQLIYQVF